MNSERNPDVTIAAWLDDGPNSLPQIAREVVVSSIHLTPQKRRPIVWLPWRTPNVNGNIWRIAAAVVIGLIVIAGGLFFLGGNQGGVGSPSTTATPAPTPTPSPSPAEISPDPGPARLEAFGQVGPPPASITVTVPWGWIADGSSVRRTGMDVEPFLIVWQISNRFSHPCTDHTLLSPAPGPGVDDLLEALASQPGITAGPIMDVTVDGYSGKSVELTVATDITTCAVVSGEDPMSGFWLWASPDGDRRYVQGSDEMDRIYALDVDGKRFTFAARIPAGTTAADLATLEAIIDSIEVEPGSATPSATP